MDDQQTINVLKGLVIDGVNSAKSGHPGGAMSSMDFAYILFTEFLKYDPDNPKWLGRDRFILSAGHESMLLYSLLHMQGFLDIAELKNFRQLHSKTPGHPENILTPGVECTTGPLGQGVAMSVGFAIAGLHLREAISSELFDHHIYALAGDGCMQEDITYGAASLAGHLGLGNLTWFYDRNRIQISGAIDRSISDDERKIYEGLGWRVLEIDGHDHSAIRSALTEAKKDCGKPTLIVADTTMAKGAASLEGSAKTHGAPLPDDERVATKKKLGLEGDFCVPEEAVSHFRRREPELKKTVATWKENLKRLQGDAQFAKKWDQHFGTIDSSSLPNVKWSGDNLATRSAFGEIIEAWADELPSLVGGSADLEPSNMTGAFAKKVGDFSKENRKGRNYAFGVREFPMAAAANGMALHGGVIPFTATFLSFADYNRPALRLGALQRIRVIHEFTHDSIFLGEDGPTHQPVEHVMSLRLIPEFDVMRPADAKETEVMMRVALNRHRPTAICLSRQGLPMLGLSEAGYNQAAKGAYVVAGDIDSADTVIYATGSEVALANEVRAELGESTAVVSVPCWELFFEQGEEYQRKILQPRIKRRLSIEAGSTLGWERFTGLAGLRIGVNRFGASAPASALAEEYGLTKKAVLDRIASHSFDKEFL